MHNCRILVNLVIWAAQDSLSFSLSAFARSVQFPVASRIGIGVGDRRNAGFLFKNIFRLRSSRGNAPVPSGRPQQIRRDSFRSRKCTAAIVRPRAPTSGRRGGSVLWIGGCEKQEPHVPLQPERERMHLAGRASRCTMATGETRICEKVSLVYNFRCDSPCALYFTMASTKTAQLGPNSRVNTGNDLQGKCSPCTETCGVAGNFHIIDQTLHYRT